MAFTVGPRAAKAGHRVLVHAQLDSTNSEALRLARAGERGPLWIVAREQSAGRGRRGRTWISAPGNLTASLLLTETLTPAVAATLGFAACLAVHEACVALAPGLRFALKWPNDVLADGGKVAGILLESETCGAGLALVAGFGINLAATPEGTEFPAASLAGLGHTVPAEAMFAALTDACTGFLETWQSGQGFGEIRRLWLDRARGIGQPISVRIGGRVESGIFETLDEQGRLMLRTASGSVAVSAGDVFFSDAATVRVTA
jgi:BirA family biotin operon repressor/biotin-[acetyl-CoA-carboxylase] ligase